MRKFIFLLLTAAIILLNTGCAASSSADSEVSAGVSEDAVSNDTTKPVIKIKLSETKVSILQGEEYDLMAGVTGSDNKDGDITDQIQVDKGGFDPAVPGEYMITYTLSDSAGNQANPVQRKIIVRNATVLAAPPVYTGTIEGEVLNPENPAVFGGAWYHKVVSSKDKWIGIEGVVTLPEVKITRYDGSYNTELDFDPYAKNLDNPSVYMGGHALSESDVGLSFSKALIDVENQKLSTGSICFRPFWRYITSEDKDEGGYDAHDGEYAVTANGNNCIANYHWRYTEYYYLPGDKLRMIIYIPAPNKMQLQIEVLEKSTLPSSVEMRKKYGWKDPANFVSPVFTSPGHGTGMNAEFKRVNAIDQSGNEGKTAIATQTEIKNAIWQETYLYREINGTVYRVPMGDNRRGVTSAPDPTKFTVTYEGVDRNLGGEVVTIHPGYSR